MLPTTADGTPLCQVPELRREPHAWVKLWKHHAAQPEADRINALAAARGEAVAAALRRADLVGVVHRQEPPDPRRGAARLPRRGPAHRGRRLDRVAADRDRDPQRVHRGLQGPVVEARRLPGRRRTSAASQPELASIVDDKLSRRIDALGTMAGGLSAEAAGWTGLRPGTPVAVANVDAHVSVPAVGVTRPGTMVAVMGTSTCHLVLGDRLALAEGMCGVVEDGIVPGLFGYEAGQSAVGDIFGWFIRNGVPPDVHEAARRDGTDVHARPRARRGRAAARRDRPAGARLVERQPLDPRRRRPQRAAARRHARHPPGRHLPGAPRVHRLRDARGSSSRSRRPAWPSTGSSPAAGCPSATRC